MATNASYFPGGRPTTDVLLKARGFAADGSRSGGIKLGGPVSVPGGALLLRLYGGSDGIGDWWLTPYELTLIIKAMGVDTAALAVGRADGKSALHGLFGLLLEWYRKNPADDTEPPNPLQIGRFIVARTGMGLSAMYGEGDVATRADFARTLKPAQIIVGGVQRAARQLFFPNARDYRTAFNVIAQSDSSTDTGLMSVLASQNWTRLSFE